jgi:4'-phosphopantetheinyl transferase EntD
VAVAVSENARLRSIGCDIEPALPLPTEVVDRVLTVAERAALGNRAPWHDRLIFCAKEAVYKAQFPLTGRRLDFHDVEVEVDGARGTFSATVRHPGLLPGAGLVFDGRFAVSDGLIAAAVEIPA